MSELVFEVTQDGGFVAECLTEAIFTQADTWEELRSKALFMTVWRPSTRSAENSCGIRQG